MCGPGFHKASSTDLLLEPSDGAFLHHFPFRDEALSRARLDVLCGADGKTGRGQEGDPATDHMLARFRSLEAVYAQRWDEVDNFMPGAETGVSVVPWDQLVDAEDRSIARWYAERDCRMTREARRPAPALVTVIVPVRNGARTLPEQFEALAAQRYDGAWELIVADNGSTDTTLAVCASWTDRLPRLRVVDASERAGSSHARNVGASAANGELLAFCDADDVVDESWLQAIVESARDHDLVGGVQDEARLNDDTIRETRGALGQARPGAPTRLPAVRAHEQPRRVGRRLPHRRRAGRRLPASS